MAEDIPQNCDGAPVGPLLASYLALAASVPLIDRPRAERSLLCDPGSFGVEFTRARLHFRDHVRVAQRIRKMSVAGGSCPKLGSMRARGCNWDQRTGRPVFSVTRHRHLLPREAPPRKMMNGVG